MPTDTLSDVDLTLRVVSAAGGRMRVQTNGFKFDDVRAVAIEDSVAVVPGVHAVQAYPRTSSIVIWSSLEHCDPELVLAAIAEARHIPAESVPGAPRTRPMAVRPEWCRKSSAGFVAC